MTEVPQRFVCFTPDNLSLSVAEDRNVVVRLSGAEKAAGLTPDLGMMMVLTPEEARRFAHALLRTADRADAGSH